MYVADESDGKIYSYNLPDAIDARLASLTLSGVEFGEFDPGRSDYEGTGGEGVTETTVEAAAMQRRADVGIEPPDADGEADGHQVALQDLSEISVTVSSADGSRTKTYRVRLGETEQESVPEPWPRCIRGDIAVGFSLVVYEGGSVEELEACARNLHVTAVYVNDSGQYLSYILGALEFVNRSFIELFPDGLPPATPLSVASDGPPPAPDPGRRRPPARHTRAERRRDRGVHQPPHAVRRRRARGCDAGDSRGRGSPERRERPHRARRRRRRCGERPPGGPGRGR